MRLMTSLVLVLILASAAYAGCWTGNGYNDPATNLVEAQVWPGDDNVTTSMDFIYTTDGTDPHSSGTVLTETGVFYQYSGNNDWYQATLTASNGDYVRWFAASWSADAEYCESDEYSFTCGVEEEVLPNLVGDCESELGLGGDWLNSDAASNLTDPNTDGVFDLTLTASSAFASSGGSGYQIVGAGGSWSPQYPGDSNIPITFGDGDVVTFYLDCNMMPGWAPETFAVSDSFLKANTHTWAAVGDWQGWDPTNAATQMTDIGGGFYYLQMPFDSTMQGTFQVKLAADGGWDLQCGVNGYGSNSSTWSFDVNAEVYVEFWFHISGRIKVVVTNIVSNEAMEWGDLKNLYK